MLHHIIHARLAIYKASWNEGTYESDASTSIEKAIIDGVDVINFSLGFPGKPLIYENAIAATSFSAIEKGIVVVTATGNQGPTLKTVDNGFPWVLTVASSTIDRWFAGSLALGNGETIYGWSMFPSDTLSPNLPLMYNRLTTLSCTSNKLYGVSNGVLSTIKLNMLNY